MPRKPTGRPNPTTAPLGKGRVLTLDPDQRQQIDRDVIGTYGGTAHRWGDEEDATAKLSRAQAGSAFHWWATMTPRERGATIARIQAECAVKHALGKERWRGVVGSRRDRKRQKG